MEAFGIVTLVLIFVAAWYSQDYDHLEDYDYNPESEEYESEDGDNLK